MDALHFAIAAGPLAAYFLLLGLVHFLARPFLTTGVRDTGALGVALAGMAVAGPMELFLPEAAAAVFGPYVWLLLLAFYGLCLLLVVLLGRPRLVIYNATPDQMRAVLSDAVAELDQEARWAGDSLVLPGLGVQLTLDGFRGLRNTQLLGAGGPQSYTGWRRLELSLRRALRDVRAAPGPQGVLFALAGLLLLSTSVLWLVSERLAVAQALTEMLRL